MKFADDTTGIGLITDNSEMEYRDEVSNLYGVTIIIRPLMWKNKGARN